MNDPITDYVVHLLSEAEHIIVSLEDVYLALESEGLMSRIPFDLFVELLATDERLAVMDGLGDSRLFAPVLQTELEVSGVLYGPMAMLRKRATSPEVLVYDVLLHLQEMNEALEQAWSRHANADPEAEAELLDMLMMGDMLERELKHVLKMNTYPQQLNRQRREVGNGDAQP